MAVSLLGRIYQSSISEDLDFSSGTVSRSYSVAYLVRATDDCNDEASVLTCPGLPSLGQKSEIHPTCYVSSRSASESSEGGLWTVSVDYATPDTGEAGGGGGGSGGGGEGGKIADPDVPPWLLPFKYSFSTTRKQSLKTWMIYLGPFRDESPGTFTPTTFQWVPAVPEKKDHFGNRVIAVTNSASEPIYYDGERILAVETKQLATTLPATGDVSIYSAYTQYLGTVNGVSETHRFFTGDPGTILLDEVSVDEAFWTDPSSGLVYSYYNVTLKKVYDPLGHFVEFADIGSLYLNGTTPSLLNSLEFLVEAKDKDGNPTTVKLNGEGDKAANQDNWFLRYCPHPIVNSSRLYLP